MEISQKLGEITLSDTKKINTTQKANGSSYHNPKRNWEKKNIFVKDRKSVIGQLVSETILTFRRYLVDQKIQNLVTAAQEQEVRAEETELLEEVMQYQSLKKILSKKLNRVL